MYDNPDRQKALLAIKKAQGNLNKVHEMTVDDKYCPDIIQQIDAVVGLLKSAKKNLLTGHLDHCLEVKIKENKQQTVEELLRILDLKN
jgi:DNA-binding FrmR family transcriptional regulator